MKKASISLLIMSALVFSFVGCGEKKVENVQDWGVVSTQEDKKESKDTVVLKSFDDYRKYVDKNIEEYKKLYEKHGIQYKLSADNSVIMNTETDYSQFGKDYKNKFAVSVGADVATGKSNVVSSVFITKNINDPYVKEDKNIALAFELLNVEDKSYTLDSFVEYLNNSFSTITSESGYFILKDDNNAKIFVDKDDSFATLFILTNREDVVEYGKVEPIEFATYEDYIKVMETTNYDYDVAHRDNIYMGGYDDASGILASMNEYMIENSNKTEDSRPDTYTVGIANAQNLDAQSGDFKIKLHMAYEGEPSNLYVGLKEMSYFTDKFNLNYDMSEVEKFLLSNLELGAFVKDYLVMPSWPMESFVSNSLAGVYGASYSRNGIPFAGMTDTKSFDYSESGNGSEIYFNVEIPAIVEGKTVR